MAVTITFSPKGMTTPMYEDVMRRLDAAGAASPKGRLFHTCFGPGDQLRVVDVWASQAEFEKFGAVLMPILAQVGVDPGTPDIQPQYNSVSGR